MKFSALARPEILAMKPYASARLSMSADGVLLNANEAPCALIEDPAPGALALNRYPPPQPAALRDRLARIFDTEPERLLVTRGSDEGIDLLLRVFCRPGLDAIAECPPCFGMYRVAASIQGAAVRSAPRSANAGWAPDVDGLCRMIRGDDTIRLVFLTSPNNPTGDSITAGKLEQVLDACEDRCLLVLDEAYVEFSAAGSAAQHWASRSHLVLLRTLSKAWAAAGLRCGAVIADPEIIGLLRRVMAPYPLSAPAVSTAMEATSDRAAKRQAAMIDSVHAEKQQLVALLESLDWVKDLWPGDANFVLARVEDANALTDWCGCQGIRIRNFHGQPMLENCVRFSIGSRDEMKALAAALEAFGASG